MQSVEIHEHAYQDQEGLEQVSWGQVDSIREKNLFSIASVCS